MSAIIRSLRPPDAREIGEKCFIERPESVDTALNALL
jgi:hypothetical protein